MVGWLRQGWVLVLLALTAPAAAQSAILECHMGAPQQRLRACAALLQRSTLPASEVALAHYFRGFAERDLGQEEAALADFDAAIRADATLWPAYWVRAELRESRRDYLPAAEDWGDVVHRYPDLAGPYARRATDLDNAGNTAEALTGYDKAIALARPQDDIRQFRADRAAALEGAHRLQEAKDAYTAAIDAGAKTQATYAGRGRSAYLLGDYAAAVADFERAAEINRRDNYMLLWLYLAESHAGRDAQAALRRRASAADLTAWPGPIVRVFLGELAPEQVAAPAEPASWTTAARKAGAECELAFYRGELKLLRQDRRGAATLFQAALSSGIKEYVEYRAAAYELRKTGR